MPISEEARRKILDRLITIKGVFIKLFEEYTTYSACKKGTLYVDNYRKVFYYNSTYHKE